MKLKKLRILHIITELELGGAQKNVLDILGLLDKASYQVYLVSSKNGLLVKQAQALAGVKVYLWPSLRRSISPLGDLVTLVKLILLCRKEKIDLVHTHSSKAGILGRWAGKFSGVRCIIHTIHGWSFHNYLNFFIKSFYVFLEKVTASFTDSLIAVSQSDVRKGLSHCIGSKAKYSLIHYGINTGEFINCRTDTANKKGQLGLGEDSIIVGMVACLKPQKAPLDFIRAASLVIRKNPHAEFILVGDGVLRKKIEQLIRQLNLGKRFILTGWRQDVAEILSCLDILALSSLWEGSPRIFLEAMCRGLPVVAYNVDGVSEVIKHGINGLLVKPGDYLDLAQQINLLIQDRDLSRNMGRYGLKLAQGDTYHLNRMSNDLNKLYRSYDKQDKNGGC